MKGLFFRVAAFLALGIPQSVFAQDGIRLGVSIGGRETVSGLPQYIASGYRYMVAIVAIVAIVMVVYGGFRYLLGSAFEDVKRGKEIIKDALIGMIIVLGAWVILHTVNPATVNLRMPALPRIERRELALTPYVAATSSVFGGNRPCAFDGQCPGEAGCFLFMTPPSGDRFSSTRNATGGICTNGGPGQLCACSGLGCTIRNRAELFQVTESASQAAATSTNAQFRMALGCQGGLDCIPARRPEQQFASDFVLPYCMQTAKMTAEQFFQIEEVRTNAGGNYRRCTNDGECQFDAAHRDWVCMHLGGDRADAGPGICRRGCRRNADCGSGRCVLSNSRPPVEFTEYTSYSEASDSGGLSGHCTYSGMIGERCYCTGTGCGAPRAAGGDVSLSATCGAGLVCGAVTNNRTHTIPRTSVRVPSSLNWDFVCLPGSLSPVSRIRGTCSYLCQRSGSAPRPPPAATIPCEGDTPEAAARICYLQGLNGSRTPNSCANQLGEGWEIECADLNAPGCNGVIRARCVPQAGAP